MQIRINLQGDHFAKKKNFRPESKTLFNSKDITFAVKSYNDSMAFFKGFASKFKVFMHIIDFDHVWINQCTFSKNRLIHSVFNKLKDSYSQYWKTCLFDDGKNAVSGNKLRTYRTFKVDYEREMYLLINDLPKTIFHLLLNSVSVLIV